MYESGCKGGRPKKTSGYETDYKKLETKKTSGYENTTDEKTSGYENVEKIDKKTIIEMKPNHNLNETETKPNVNDNDNDNVNENDNDNVNGNENGKEKPSQQAYLNFIKFDNPQETEGWKQLLIRWLDYKKDIKDGYKSIQSIEVCYKNLLEFSDKNLEKAREIVNNSIGNGYRGLFSPSQKNNKQKKKTVW